MNDLQKEATKEELEAERDVLRQKYKDAIDRSVVSIHSSIEEFSAARWTQKYEVPSLRDQLGHIEQQLRSYGKKTFTITTTLDDEVIQLEATSAKDAMEGFLLQLPCWCGTFEATITDGTVETKFTCKLEYKVIQHE